MKSQITNLGKVAPTFEGAFDPTKPYDRLCCVFDSESGSSYISRKPVPIGIKIYDINYWQPLAIGSNRLPLTETFGNDSFRAMTQKFLTELWNKQYAFNDNVETQLNGFSFGLMTEDEFEDANNNNLIPENQITFTY